MKEFKTAKGTTLPLLDLKGKSYLQVAHRLVWFREEKPDWSIQTTVDRNGNHAIARASICNESGRVIATATKFEDEAGFRDFVEKAETGAVGRALALCGYGTQFAPELEEGERLADAPVEKKSQTVVTQTQSPLVATASSAICEICGAKLKPTKTGDAYNCPNWKDQSNGKHSYVKAGEIEAFKAWQASAANPAAPMQELDIPF